MRYSVHPSRAFRNRIAKSIGVLVAAALIATLGLPSAAQAQTIPAKDGITYTDDLTASPLMGSPGTLAGRQWSTTGS